MAEEPTLATPDKKNQTNEGPPPEAPAEAAPPSEAEKTQEEKSADSSQEDSPAPVAKTNEAADAPEASTEGETPPKKKRRRKKKRRKVKKKKKSVFALTTELLQEIGITVKEMSKALVSKDSPTRRMSVLFFVCLLAAGGTFAFALLYMSEQLRSGDAPIEMMGESDAQRIERMMKREQANADARATTFAVGKYSIPLIIDPTAPVYSGVLNRAELEVVVECGTARTCKFLEQNIDRVRDQLSEVFVEMDRNELISFEGKKNLKARIREKLNSWLRNGEIKDVFFVKLVVG